MVRKRHDDQFVTSFDNNDVVWETAENEAFRAFTARASGHRGKRKEAVFYNIKGRFNRVDKFIAETLPLLFIPISRRLGFLGGLPENSCVGHY